MTTNEQMVSVSREIDASPEAIFDVLADPRQHAAIDGSGSVKGVVDGPDRLELGSKFGMKMKIGLPYRVKSTVVEYNKNELIAWAHLGKHRWRYTLEPIDGGSRTKVTETFDYSTARSPWFIEKMGYPRKHPAAMEATLERLDQHVSETT